MSELALVPQHHTFTRFHGAELEGCEIDGVWYVAMRRVCRAFGLNWQGQHQRILRDPILSKGVCVIQTPSEGGSQETVCLRLDMFWGWLFKLQLSRLDPDVQEILIPFQLAGYQALHEHFTGSKPEVKYLGPAESTLGFEEGDMTIHDAHIIAILRGADDPLSLSQIKSYLPKCSFPQVLLHTRRMVERGQLIKEGNLYAVSQ